MDLLKSKEALLELVDRLNQKYELSKNISEDYFEPGMMENLEQYKGEYIESENVIVMRVNAKGLRYDNRTYNLEKLTVGGAVEITRDADNLYNANNFTIKSGIYSLGNLPAELCNALAPLYDAGNAVIEKSDVSYMEKLKDRSRYAQQGVLFIELHIRLKGI